MLFNTPTNSSINKVVYVFFLIMRQKVKIFYVKNEL